jgi:hypothetical protein
MCGCITEKDELKGFSERIRQRSSMVEDEEANSEEKRPMSESKMPRWQDWAQFRFSVIGALLSSPPENGELQRELEALSGKSYRHPFIPRVFLF